MTVMNCFTCDMEGKAEPAIGVCHVCGRAVCRKHLVIKHLPIRRKVASGMGFRVEVLPGKQSRILCLECAEVPDAEADPE